MKNWGFFIFFASPIKIFVPNRLCSPICCAKNYQEVYKCHRKPSHTIRSHIHPILAYLIVIIAQVRDFEPFAWLWLAPCFKLTNENNHIYGDRSWNKKFPDIDLPEFPRIGDSTATHKDRTRDRSRTPRRNLNVVSENNQKTSIEVFDLLYVSDHPAIYGWIEEEN